ncbi:MAG: MiaB/RimO family radical SAM methylthiotransferase [Thermoplasmata archaeon]
MKYYVEAYGCTMNQGETTMLAEKMAGEGHIEVSDPAHADTAVIGTCVVIKKTEERMKRRIAELKKYCDVVLVTGCLASTGKSKLERCSDLKLVEPGEIDMSFTPKPSLVGIVPISTGCTGSCTYCITKLARGALKSRSVSSIEQRFENLLKTGVKEVRVTSQDNASYGLDIGTDLIKLMKKLEMHGGEHRIRLGMMNPNTALSIEDELLEVMSDSHYYRFFHLPLQSGSNRILRSMNRGYTVQDWEDLIINIRKRLPDVTISTDVIVGFPGESEEDFKRTASVLKKIKPDITNITRFSSRPGTAADSMDKRIHSRDKKKRSKTLTGIHERNNKDNNRKFVGTKTRMLVLKEGKNDTLTGRMDNYKVVVIDKIRDDLLGKWVEVEIVDERSVYLKGEPI